MKKGCEDYVSVVLCDKVDFDVIDMQDRLRLEFPNLLEIRRESQIKADYQLVLEKKEILDPFGLCCSFMKDKIDEENEDAYQQILQEVINTVMNDAG